MQITGELALYNEFGEKTICWGYWMKIIGAGPMMSKALPQ